MMGDYIHSIHEGNAEEKLPEVLELIKAKVKSEARSKAFQDCTTYWAGQVENILKDPAPSAAKLSRIRQLFNITYEEGM
jgi:hypothetical protein